VTVGAVNVRHPGNHRYCLTLGGRRNAWHLALAPHPYRPTRATYQPQLITHGAVPADNTDSCSVPAATTIGMRG